MTLSFTGRKRLRKNFGKIQEIAQMPNLIEVQRTSYDQFLQLAKGDGRKDEGLEAVFRQVFPIKDFSESSLLEEALLALLLFEFDFGCRASHFACASATGTLLCRFQAFSGTADSICGTTGLFSCISS